VGQAAATGPLLAAYGVTRLISSPARRCVDTLAPYAAATATSIKVKEGLSEEGFTARPDRAPHHLRRTLERGRPTAICSHGPVLPTLLDAVADQLDTSGEAGKEAAALIAESADQSMAKGEVLVCHVVSTGSAARVVAAERHQT
ncbi:MAG: histidine phosphatase family protein, partial [Actinomycetota bacterium]|nr:histidine phosphatase family protein [Actinomycetota bacterium]